MLEQKRSKKMCGENVLPLLIVVASEKFMGFLVEKLGHSF
jgi:hypothetical protein